jgi:hypothetical protein
MFPNVCADVTPGHLRRIAPRTDNIEVNPGFHERVFLSVSSLNFPSLVIKYFFDGMTTLPNPHNEEFPLKLVSITG